MNLFIVTKKINKRNIWYYDLSFRLNIYVPKDQVNGIDLFIFKTYKNLFDGSKRSKKWIN